MAAEVPSLETRNLTVAFGGHVAVAEVSCAFERDTLTAIVGPNGAGKTTYFNLISGQLRPSAGDILLDGVAISGEGPAIRARRGIGRAFQLTNLFPALSVLENVRIAVQSHAGVGLDLLGMASRRRDLIDAARACLDRVKLGARAETQAAALSHGDQRKLEVAVLLAIEPEIFMFDEPTAGMSVDEVPVILDLIEEIKETGGKTVLLVEHKMDVVRRLADRVVVLNQGALVADGPPAEVVASPIVREAYLGLGGATAGARH